MLTIHEILIQLHIEYSFSDLSIIQLQYYKMADVKDLPKVEANLKSEIEKPADLKHVEVSNKNIMPYPLAKN